MKARMSAPDPNVVTHNITKARLFGSTGLTQAKLTRSGLGWVRLQEVYQDYLQRKPFLSAAAQSAVNTLQLCPLIQAVSHRPKDPEHLVGKIIRLVLEKKMTRAQVAQYLTRITDLIGMRGLILFKEDWPEVHAFIQKNIPYQGQPRAIVHPNDPDDILKMYSTNGCVIDVRPSGYRSVHYDICLKCGNIDLIGELQVRTLFEQAWGEISHKVEYPYLTGVPFLRRFTGVLSEMSGYADLVASAARTASEIAKIARASMPQAIRTRRIRELQLVLNRQLEGILTSNPSAHRLMINPAHAPPEVLQAETRQQIR